MHLDAIEAGDRVYRDRMASDSHTMRVALGIAWPCGHDRMPRTTHSINGDKQCKVCRRRRWQRGFRAVVAVKLVTIAEQREIECDRLEMSLLALEAAHEHRRDTLRRLKETRGGGRLPFDELVYGVCKSYHLKRSELLGNCREAHIVRARSLIARILRDRGLSYPVIGRLLGGRDHSTVIHSIRHFEGYLEKDPVAASTYEALRDA